jgi:hydroxymethylbilane synthase
MWLDLRGNVTRLTQKLRDKLNGAVFAAAGPERINIKPDNFIDLD